MRNLTFLKTFISACTLALPLGALPADGAFSQSNDWIIKANLTSIIQDTGVANRLVVAEVLLSLTQEIPAAACHLRNQVNVEDATDLMSTGLAQVDELLEALVEGDIFWGIEDAEERRKTIADIEALRAKWLPIQEAGQQMLLDHTDEDALGVIYETAEVVLEDSYNLLTTLEAQYSSSAEILKRDVMNINLSGRMATLNQRLAYKACLLWSNGMDPEIAEDLSMTIGHYGNTVAALRDGFEAMGILPPRNPGIADKLDEISAVWSQNRPLLDLVAAGEEISEEQRFELYYQMIDERVLVLDLLYLYQDHSKVH